jgi:phage terminase small subunit
VTDIDENKVLKVMKEELGEFACKEASRTEFDALQETRALLLRNCSIQAMGKKEMMSVIPLRLEEVNEKIRKLNVEQNKVMPMRCVKHDHFQDKSLMEILSNVNGFKVMEKASLEEGKEGKAYIFCYKDQKGGEMFVLERQKKEEKENSVSDAWQFAHSFNLASAKEFMKQFDESRKKEREKELSIGNEVKAGVKR